jgi:hypothetical protein
MNSTVDTSDETKRVLERQFDTAWSLTQYHLDGLTTEECLWRPTPTGPHVTQLSDGRWQADWPEREDYAAGAPSIAWLTWHVGFWWSMTLDHCFGPATLTREEIRWPGDADGVREWITELEGKWRRAVAELTAAELASSERTRWPFHERPFADVVAWLNVELMKNAAEIGYGRFLYGSQADEADGQSTAENTSRG